LSLGVREASVVEKAPPARTSMPVPTLWKEDPAAALAANLVSVPPVDAALMGVDFIVLSSYNEDEVDCKALVAGDEVDWEALAAKDINDIESVGSWSLTRI
jgi:predicted dinucleotide-binding enzyme